MFGYFTWKQYTDYPIVTKGKVMRYEAQKEAGIDKNKTKYYYIFEARHNGYHIVYDQKGYKDKTFKSHERITIHMNKKGDKCMSNISLIPFIVCMLSLILSAAMIVGYFSEQRNARLAEQAENTLYQEAGRYIMTDTDVLFAGDSIGLVRLSGETGDGISTGDKGAIFFLGTPKQDEEGKLNYVTPFTANVYEDGTPEDIDDFYIDKTIELGYTVNMEITEYVAPVYEEDADIESDEEKLSDSEPLPTEEQTEVD